MNNDLQQSPFYMTSLQLSLLIGTLIQQLKSASIVVLSAEIADHRLKNRADAERLREIERVGRYTLPSLRMRIMQATTLLVSARVPEGEEEDRSAPLGIDHYDAEAERSPHDGTLELVRRLNETIDRLLALEDNDDPEPAYVSVCELLTKHAFVTDRRWIQISDARNRLETRLSTTHPPRTRSARAVKK